MALIIAVPVISESGTLMSSALLFAKIENVFQTNNSYKHAAFLPNLFM
jgi:hypothetical protein